MSTRSSSTRHSSRRSETRSVRGRTSTCTSPTHLPSTSGGWCPTPTKLVANLPYNVATPIVAETLTGRADARLVVRDGAARGRRPLLRGTGDEGVWRRLRARPAPRRANGLPSGLAHGLPTDPERRLGARRLRADPGARGHRAHPRGSSAARSRIGGRRLRTPSRSPASRGVSRSSRRLPRSAGGRTSRAEALAPEEFVELAATLGAMSAWLEAPRAGEAESRARRRPAPA